MTISADIMMTSADSESAVRSRARTAGIASFMGTTIEWYDFYIYGLAASLVFGNLFFPKELEPSMATLLSFMTLWIGFLARPIGGIIFGHLGDRIGRKTTLVITLIMMGLSTVGIGLLPTYAQIGAWAPAALVFFRILQGIAVGGEWGGAVLIASENAPKGKGVLYSAFAQQGAPVGNLLATGVFFLLSSDVKSEFLLNGGWRIPFLLSAALIVVGVIIRTKIQDPENVKKLISQSSKVEKFPITEAIHDHWKLILLAAGCLPIIYATYFKSNFAVSWATSSVGYDTKTFLGMVTISVIVQCLTQPFGAVLATKMDMRKAIMLITIPEFFLMPLMFYAIQSKIYWLALLAMCLATIPHGMFYGAIGGILARAFPTRVRYTGLSLANQLSAVAIGGATPVLAQSVLQATGNIAGVALVSGSYALVSLICSLLLLKQTGSTAKELSSAERADSAQLQTIGAADRRTPVSRDPRAADL